MLNHFINMSLFYVIVTEPDLSVNFDFNIWGFLLFIFFYYKDMLN